MGWLAGLWTELRQQSAAWQTRPREVWSSHGGRRRQVTVVWPAGERGMWRHDAVRVLQLLVAAAVAAVLSIGAVEVVDHVVLETDLTADDPLGDPTYGVLLLAAFIVVSWVVIGVVAVVVLVGRARSRRRAETVEGTVILRQRVAHLGDGDTVYVPFLAVDDGAADTITAFRVDPHVYERFAAGDVVRLTVAAGRGGAHRVLHVEPLPGASRQGS